MKLVPTTLLVGALLLASADDPLPYEDLATRCLERYGLDPERAAELEPADLLSAGYDRARLGCLEVWLPVGYLTDTTWFAELRDVASVLVRAQAHWIAWVHPDKDQRPEASATAIDDLEALADYVDKWKIGKAKLRREGGTRDLVELFGAKPKVLEAAVRLAAFADAGGPFGEARDTPALARVVFAPTRAEFVELACAVGMLDDELRELIWLEGLERWTEFRFGDARVVALEFFAGLDAEDFRKGMPMDVKDETHLTQQVMQLGLLTLFEVAHGDATGKAFDAGLASNLVIEEFDEVETRTDGDLKERESAGRAAFVPGGASSGGTFPPTIADSRWRLDHGRHHFVRVLKKAQLDGAKKVEREDKLRAFLLQNESGSEKYVILAPFLGKDAKGVPPPEEFEGDWEDFLRSYRIAFLHWLRGEGGGRKTESVERFGRLLAGLGADGDPDLLDLVPQVYEGAELSEAALGEGTLEGRFLRWLAKQ